MDVKMMIGFSTVLGLARPKKTNSDLRVSINPRIQLLLFAAVLMMVRLVTPWMDIAAMFQAMLCPIMWQSRNVQNVGNVFAQKRRF